MAKNDKCRLEECDRLVTKNRGTLCEYHRYRWEKYKDINFQPKNKIFPDGTLLHCKIHGFLNKDQIKFYERKNRKTIQKRCKECHKIFQKKCKDKLYISNRIEINNRRKQKYYENLEKNHDYNRKNRFGITKEQYQKMLTEQNYVCAICFKKETVKRNGRTRNLSVDHCHISENNGSLKIRGLLCSKCNIAFGAFQESIEILQNAIKYAIKYNIK